MSHSHLGCARLVNLRAVGAELLSFLVTGAIGMALWRFLMSWLDKTHERSSGREGSTQGSDDGEGAKTDHPQTQDEVLHAHEPALRAGIVGNQDDEADAEEADAGTDKAHNIADEKAPHESEGIARASGLRRLFTRKGSAAMDVEARDSTDSHGDRGPAHATVSVQK